jgi:hypothetical protein
MIYCVSREVDSRRRSVVVQNVGESRPVTFEMVMSLGSRGWPVRVWSSVPGEDAEASSSCLGALNGLRARSMRWSCVSPGSLVSSDAEFSDGFLRIPSGVGFWEVSFSGIRRPRGI